MKPRVFIPQVPSRVDGTTGRLVPTIDLRPAKSFGELIYLLDPGRAATDPEISLPILREKLKDFGREDFILPIGTPVLIAWTAVIAASIHDHPIKMLSWDGKTGVYDVLVADL